MIRIQHTFAFQIGILAGVCAPLLAAQTIGSRSILRTQEFRDNRWLVAHTGQTVVLDDGPNPFEDPVIRYEGRRQP
jgi:hypothetical protein